MDENKVEVQEVKPAVVSEGKAWRIITGKFIVDFIETLSISLPIGVLFLPTSMEDLQKLWIVLSVPVGSSVVSALRRNWPAIKKWISPSS